MTRSLRGVPDEAVAAVQRAAEAHFAGLPPWRLDRLSLFIEPTPGADFVLLEHTGVVFVTRRLIYVVGPSGAGKDSVLLGLRDTWSAQAPAHWARRTVTRPSQAGGEHHESVTRAEFERLRETASFAMHWEANTLCYGVRRTELEPLDSGHCVLVNGSRAYTPTVLRQWPDATVVHITAPADLLLQRLKARKREDTLAISDRLARNLDIELPDHTIRIVNDGALQEAVGMLAAALRVRLASGPVGVS